MNGRLGKSKLNSLRILLDFGSKPSIILGKHTQKLIKEHITQGGDLNTKFTSKV